MTLRDVKQHVISGGWGGIPLDTPFGRERPESEMSSHKGKPIASRRRTLMSTTMDLAFQTTYDRKRWVRGIAWIKRGPKDYNALKISDKQWRAYTLQEKGDHLKQLFQKKWKRKNMWVETEKICDESRPFPSNVCGNWERYDVKRKVQLWNSITEKTGFVKRDVSYTDGLDLGTYVMITDMAHKQHLRDRNRKWNKIHEELHLLPRCPEHDTVS